VAAKHVAGVRCDPCGTVRWTSFLRSKHVGLLLSIFMYSNIEINILD